MPKKLSQRDITIKTCEKFLANKKLYKYARPFHAADILRICKKAKHTDKVFYYTLLFADARLMKLGILYNISQGMFSEKENEMLRKAISVIRMFYGFEP